MIIAKVRINHNLYDQTIVSFPFCAPSYLGIKLWDKLSSVSEERVLINDGKEAMLLCDRSNLISFVNEDDIICFGIESKWLLSSLICFNDDGNIGSLTLVVLILLLLLCLVVSGGCATTPRLFLPADSICKFLRCDIAWRLCKLLFSMLSDLIFINDLWDEQNQKKIPWVRVVFSYLSYSHRKDPSTLFIYWRIRLTIILQTKHLAYYWISRELLNLWAYPKKKTNFIFHHCKKKMKGKIQRQNKS